MQAGELRLHAEWLDGRERGAYHDAHIPGAVLLDTDRLEDGYPTWRLRGAAELAAVFGACGVRRDQPVAVYGSDLAAACRVWWVLRWLGATRASLLVEGLDGWRAAGGGFEAVTTVPEPCEFEVALEPHWLAGSDDVLAVVEGRSDACLVDVRSRAEFAGERSGYDYLVRAGRIPGALHAHVAPLTELLRRGDRAGIADYWQRCGVDFTRRDGVIFHCGSGWRSAVACHAAHLLGLQARNYSDGWCGWSTDYVRDAAAGGQTPGWRQQASGRPCIPGRT
jgi:thiosulfate/3-mercaptopyruvate sulfurtransferase